MKFIISFIVVFWTAVFWTAVFWAAGAFAVGESGTLHTADWITTAAYIFAPFGAAGWLATVVPSSWRQYIPILKVVFNFASTNFGNAKNKGD